MDNFRFLNTHLNGSLVNKGEFLIRIIWLFIYIIIN
jgi:hypothetical protein